MTRYYRSKRGRGFVFTDQEGLRVVDPQLKEYFKSLVIPPAWQSVEISGSPRARIWATGIDAKGRKQYIYNSRYREKQNAKKFDRIISFAAQLEHMRRVTGQHLRRRKPGREKVLATMVRLLETAFFRPGNEAYARENKSYGLTTLRSKHLCIEGDEIIFSYKGKSGQQQERHILDGKLARIVQELDELPGYEIFKYEEEDGQIIDVKSNDLNDYIREIMGAEFSAKDFRTWAGTVIAAMALDELGAVKPQEQKKLNHNIRQAVITVSEKLGNTPAIARSSYIDPRVIDNYIHGKTISYFKAAVNKMLKTNENLSVEELGVLCLLKRRWTGIKRKTTVRKTSASSSK